MSELSVRIKLNIELIPQLEKGVTVLSFGGLKDFEKWSRCNSMKYSEGA